VPPKPGSVGHPTWLFPRPTLVYVGDDAEKVGIEPMWPDTRTPSRPHWGRRVFLAALALCIVAWALVLAGVAPRFWEPDHGPSKTSPVATAMDWYAAANRHDVGGWIADMTFGDVTPSVGMDGIHYSNVRCRTLEHSITSARLYCTFHEDAPAGIQTQTFNTIDLIRSPERYWLISNYGTP
jgi:hypothetical protein